MRTVSPIWECSPAELHKRLTVGPLPKVWIPDPRDFIHIDEIPDHVHGQGRPAPAQEIAL